MVPQYCILNVLVGSSLWQCVDRLGHTGSTVEQQLFSVDPSLVLIHQCLSLFQPVKAMTGVGAIKPGDLFEGLVYPASLLIFAFLYLFSVFFPLFPFFFHSFPFFLLFLHFVVLLHCGCLSLNPFIETSIRNNSSSSDVLNIQASISISPKFESK